MNRVFLFTTITACCVYLTPAELPLPSINPYHACPARTVPSGTTTLLAPRSPLQAPFALPNLQRVPSDTTTPARTMRAMGRVEMVGAGAAGAGAGAARAGDAKSSSHMGKQLPTKQPAQKAVTVRSKGNNSTGKVGSQGIRAVSSKGNTQSHPSITVRTTVRSSVRSSAHSVTRTHTVTQSSHVRR
jgi:hypothetical protein